VRVATGRGNVVLASDAAHFFANMELENPFPIVVDMAAMMDSWNRLRELADSPDHIVPGHDPLVMSFYPGFAGAEVQAVCLHEPPRR
jgi:glyoxylase-like metal-dependent hydrolase (beta-lactamase superfamily II)